MELRAQEKLIAIVGGLILGTAVGLISAFLTYHYQLGNFILPIVASLIRCLCLGF